MPDACKLMSDYAPFSWVVAGYAIALGIAIGYLLYALTCLWWVRLKIALRSKTDAP